MNIENIFCQLPVLKSFPKKEIYKLLYLSKKIRNVYIQNVYILEDRPETKLLILEQCDRLKKYFYPSIGQIRLMFDFERYNSLKFLVEKCQIQHHANSICTQKINTLRWSFYIKIHKFVQMEKKYFYWFYVQSNANARDVILHDMCNFSGLLIFLLIRENYEHWSEFHKTYLECKGFDLYLNDIVNDMVTTFYDKKHIGYILYLCRNLHDSQKCELQRVLSQHTNHDVKY